MEWRGGGGGVTHNTSIIFYNNILFEYSLPRENISVILPCLENMSVIFPDSARTSICLS